jgi:hypothetical protein
LRDALLSILSWTVGLAVAIRSCVCLTLGGVLLALRDVELRTVGFAIVPVVGTPNTFVELALNGVAVSKEIFAI